MRGFEILVASSNNKAVENVSGELPSLGAIASDAAGLRYLKTVSDGVLARETWGLVAAILGNRANLGKFKQAFWWDKDRGLATYLAEVAGTPQIIDEIDGTTGKLLGTRRPRVVLDENPPATPAEAKKRWMAARLAFQQASSASRSALKALEEARAQNLQLPALRQNLRSAEDRREHAFQEERNAFAAVERSRLSATQAAGELEAAAMNLTVHQRRRPGFFHRLFRTAAARAWNRDSDQLRHDRDRLAAVSRDLAARASAAEAQHRAAMAAFQEAERNEGARPTTLGPGGSCGGGRP